GHDCAITLCATARLDPPTWTKVRPGKFLFTRPYQLHWFTGRLGQACSFNRAFPSVLAAVSRACVRNHNMDLLWRSVKRRGQLIAHREWTLRACPHRKLVTAPLRHCCAWLKWRMRDILDGVGR